MLKEGWKENASLQISFTLKKRHKLPASLKFLI